jgi:hypothetical protein
MKYLSVFIAKIIDNMKKKIYNYFEKQCAVNRTVFLTKSARKLLFLHGPNNSISELPRNQYAKALLIWIDTGAGFWR